MEPPTLRMGGKQRSPSSAVARTLWRDQPRPSPPGRGRAVDRLLEFSSSMVPSSAMGTHVGCYIFKIRFEALPQSLSEKPLFSQLRRKLCRIRPFFDKVFDKVFDK